MAQAAFSRPAGRSALAAGQVVIGPDRYHEDGSGRRPYLVLQVSGDQAYVVEFSHTPQGGWVTDELGGGSYLALWDFRSHEWLGRWVPAALCGRYRRQLSAPSRESALDYCAAQFARRR